MNTENKLENGNGSDASTCSAGWGRLNAIAQGLELHGYELSRGIGKGAERKQIQKR